MTYHIVLAPKVKSIPFFAFTEDALYANSVVLIEAIMSSDTQGARGQHVKSLYLSTTMGPGLKLDLAEFRKG